MNFICAIHIDERGVGYLLDIITASCLTMLFKRLTRHIQKELNTCTEPKSYTQESFDSWLQDVCNIFVFCNVHYKIQLTQERFFCKEDQDRLVF